MPPSSGISIRVLGVDEVYAKLGNLEGSKFMKPPMEQTTIKLYGDMKPYPPPLPQQKYVRTDKLSQNWTRKVDVSSDGVVGRVGNNREYAPWVQSSRFQAAIHRGRWQTDRDVMDRNRDRIVGYFQAAIRRALGG